MTGHLSVFIPLSFTIPWMMEIDPDWKFDLGHFSSGYFRTELDRTGLQCNGTMDRPSVSTMRIHIQGVGLVPRIIFPVALFA